MLEGTKKSRSPVPVRQVAVYQNPSEAPCEYQRVALIESMASSQSTLGSGVSNIKLIRAARRKAGALGANAIIIETVGSESYIATEVSADSAGYNRSESRKSWGRGMFLAVHEARPCSTSARRGFALPHQVRLNQHRRGGGVSR